MKVNIFVAEFTGTLDKRYDHLEMRREWGLEVVTMTKKVITF